MKPITLALLAVAALLLAGCSSAPAGPAEPTKDSQGRHVIHATGANTFTPANAKVPVGATVLWINDAGVHDVIADDDSFSSDKTLGKKMNGAGAEFSHTFTSAGTFPYTCTIHASTGMKGTLTVA